jgi:mono/diheme cytochrome c family protein
MMNRFLALVLVVVSASPLVAQDSAAVPERPVAGSFSEGQVTLGEGVFKATCASCHETSFHTGEQFRFSWYGRTLFDYFKIVKSTMPEDNPGGLSDDDYVRVITYIMKLNGFAAGVDSLKADTLELKRIRIGDSTSARSP